MEEFKDVMLSEPPTRSRAPAAAAAAADGGGGGGGYNGPSRSFENYKGILLCDRPSDQKAMPGVAEQPFLPPGKPERDVFGLPGSYGGCLGLQPSQEQTNRNTSARHARLENSKHVPPTALSRHRRWLKSLALETQKNKLDNVEQSLALDDRKKKFQESETKKRHQMLDISGQDPSGRALTGILRQSRTAADPGSNSNNINGSGNDDGRCEDTDQANSIPADEIMHQPHRPSTPPTGSEDDHRKYEAAAAGGGGRPQSGGNGQAASGLPVVSPSASAKKSGGKKKEKPKWAMTEDEAFDSEMRQAQKLVDFAMNVDFSKFIEDYEVREALSIMRERVEELAEEKGPDDANEDDDASSVTSSQLQEAAETGNPATAAITRKRAKALKKRRAAVAAGGAPTTDKEWDSSANPEVSKLIGDDAARLASYILDRSEQLKQIHSTKSLAKLLQDIASNKNIVLPPRKDVPPGAPTEIQAPVISTIGGHGDCKQRRVLTALKHSKDYVQNLPYLYRCPSI